jgi:DNA-binding MarR family transcriptional regulator
MDDVSGEVTMAQGLVLYHLAKTPSDCVIQQDLAEILNINKSGLLRTIDILEKKGFLKRLPVENDRRKNHVEITEAGKIELDKFIEVVSGKDADLKKGFTKTELEAFFKIIGAFKNKLFSAI